MSILFRPISLHSGKPDPVVVASSLPLRVSHRRFYIHVPLEPLRINNVGRLPGPFLPERKWIRWFATSSFVESHVVTPVSINVPAFTRGSALWHGMNWLVARSKYKLNRCMNHAASVADKLDKNLLMLLPPCNRAKTGIHFPPYVQK